MSFTESTATPLETIAPIILPLSESERPKKVTHICWRCTKNVNGEKIKAIDPNNVEERNALNVHREYDVTEWQAAKNSMTSMAKGPCPVCSVKLCRVVSLKPKTPVAVTEA